MKQMGKTLYIALNNLIVERRSTCSKPRFHHSHVVPTFHRGLC